MGSQGAGPATNSSACAHCPVRSYMRNMKEAQNKKTSSNTDVHTLENKYMEYSTLMLSDNTCRL